MRFTDAELLLFFTETLIVQTSLIIIYAILCCSRDREGDRRDRENRDNKGPSRSNRDRELDEDDSYERRKRERRQKERSQAYVEVGNFECTLKHRILNLTQMRSFHFSLFLIKRRNACHWEYYLIFLPIFLQRLKAWETRERKKQREYDRELEKERENDMEQV